MSETVARHRPSVDLDDFERRARQPMRPQQHHQGYEDDPLAELARLVGEEPDPYGDVFARSPAPSHDDGSHDATQRREPAFGRGLDFASIEAGLRGAIPAHPEHDQRYANHRAPDAHGQFHGHDQHRQDYAEPTFETDPSAEAPQDWQPRTQAKSRRPIYAMIATIAVGIIGIGVAFAFKGASSSPREIKTIMAAAGPTKIQPPADASADDASQTGVGTQSPTKLASREEQPVDLSQAVQDNAARDAANQQTGDQGAAGVPVPLSPGRAGTQNGTPDYSALGAGQDQPSQSGSQGFGAGMPAPKKVKVVSVRPDGSIVSNEVAVPPAGADVASLAANPTPSSEAQNLPQDLPKVADKPVKKTTKTTSRVTPKPVDIASTDSATDAPTKPAKSVKKAKPTQVASADTGDQATADAAEPKGNGAFAVQFAAPTTEAEAKAASAKFGKKFASALSGHRLGFRKAESNGRSVYRVRSGGLSREEATSLCDKVKADGGTCFVAKG